MSGEQTYAEDLAERCRRAGFNVVRTGDGFRAENGKGESVGWHLTPSDKAWRRNTMQRLNRMGLAERETHQETAEALKRKKTLAADRKRNEIETAKVVAKANAAPVALRRAAGEYAAYDESDAAWIFRKHSAPAARQYDVTPALAAKMLQRNTSNRPLKERHLSGLRADMADGTFLATHQGVAFDVNGVFFDGQHRLQAIVDTGTTQRLFVYVGIDPRAVHYVDQHSRRSGKDTLTMGSHRVANATAVAALIRFVYGYDHAEPSMWHHTRISNEQTAKEFEANGDDYSWAVKQARSARYAHPGYTATPVGALLYILKRRGVALHDIDDFLHGFKTGENLPGGHPCLLLRRQADKYDDMSGHMVRHKIQFGEWVMAWNAYLSGRKLSVFNHRLDDPIPPIATRE